LKKKEKQDQQKAIKNWVTKSGGRSVSIVQFQEKGIKKGGEEGRKAKTAQNLA